MEKVSKLAILILIVVPLSGCPTVAIDTGLWLFVLSPLPNSFLGIALLDGGSSAA